MASFIVHVGWLLGNHVFWGNILLFYDVDMKRTEVDGSVKILNKR